MYPEVALPSSWVLVLQGKEPNQEGFMGERDCMAFRIAYFQCILTVGGSSLVVFGRRIEFAQRLLNLVFGTSDTYHTPGVKLGKYTRFQEIM
jgi:hypothetical protein